jgi:hypothetical protein
MIRPLCVAGLSLVVGLAAAVPVIAQRPVATYSAQVVNFEASTGAATFLAQIQITRWSTDAERDTLTNVLFEKSQKDLLQAVSKMPTVGSIRTPDSVGYPLRYARRTMASENGENILIISDREMSFGELRAAPRSIDYPFTVIRMQLNSQGRGQGDILLATKISASKATKDIAFESFTTTPLKLQNVRRE